MGYLEDIRSVSNLALPWDYFSGKNILVTGATGLIGRTLIDVLLNRNEIDYTVYAAGRNEDRVVEQFKKYYLTGNLHFIKHDITKPLECDVDFHVVINGASGADPKSFSTNPTGVILANIIGTDNLLSYGLHHHLERFVYISSGEIYGEGDGRVFTEEYNGYVDCASVRACYPSSKRAAETLCVSYASQYGIDARIARLCHIYGPHFTESDTRVYAQFIRNVLNNEDIVLKSTGEQFRSWCYVVDAVSALLFILLKGKNSEAYNVADAASNISIRELAEISAKIAGKEVIFELPTDKEKMGFNVVKKSVFSSSKLEQLGWTPQTHISDGLKKTIDFLLSGDGKGNTNR